MRSNLKKMLSYYRPYLGVFFADLFFAVLSAGIALVFPLVVRYVTSTLIYQPKEELVSQILVIGAIHVGLVLVDLWCSFILQARVT